VSLHLRAAGLPFRVRSETDLFVLPEVRDLVAYLRLAHCPTDGPAMARVINTPPRRLGAIEQALRRRPVPAAELPAWAHKRAGPTARSTVETFLGFVADLHRDTQGKQPCEFLETVLERTGYSTWLGAEKDGLRSRLQAVDDLRTIMRASAATDLATWLVDMHLGQVDGPADTGSEAVTLTTIHGAKGSEWPVVFVLGFEEGLLPHGHPSGGGAALRAESEERRLAYVALSRTQVLLYLIYCRARRVTVRGAPGRLAPRQPSRFLLSLPSALIERVDNGRAA
jgi:superfamily I DNA/RNA helicase